MTVEASLRQELNEAARRLSVPPQVVPADVAARARKRHTRHVASYSLVAVIAVAAATLGAIQLVGRAKPGLEVAGGPEGPQDVVIFVCDGARCPAITPTQRQELRAALESDPATVDVTFESKQDAYERFIERFGDQPDFTDGVTAKELPASFRVVVAGDVNAETFAARYEPYAGVESAVVQRAAAPVDPSPQPDDAVENLPGHAAGTGFPEGVAYLEGVEGLQVVDAASLEGSARRAGLAPAHAAALSDGTVTFAEYKALYDDFVSCTAQRSITLHIRPPMHDPIRDLDVFVYGVPDIPGEGPPDSAVAECATRHYYAAEELYIAQHERPRDEQREQLAQRFRDQYECYVNQGADLPFPVTSADDHEHELLTLMDAYPACGSPLD